MFIQLYVIDAFLCHARVRVLPLTAIDTFRVNKMVCAYPGGKVRAISREALVRGDIARDPTRLRQIPWLRVRLCEMMEWRDLACI